MKLRQDSAELIDLVIKELENEATAALKYNQVIFLSVIEDADNNVCGTSGCLAGKMVAIRRPDLLQTAIAMYKAGHRRSVQELIADAAEELLFLEDGTLAGTCNLFGFGSNWIAPFGLDYSSCHTDECNRRVAIQRLEYFKEHGV